MIMPDASTDSDAALQQGHLPLTSKTATSTSKRSFQSLYYCILLSSFVVSTSHLSIEEPLRTAQGEGV